MRIYNNLSGFILAFAVLGMPQLALAQTTTPPAPAPAVVAKPDAAAPVVPVAPAVPATPPAATPPAATTTPPAPDSHLPDLTTPPADAPGDATEPETGDDMSIGDVPDVKTEELTADIARKALDAYVLVQTKYQDSPLESYDDLQGFVDKDPRGKEFETDIKSFGFTSVDDWNLAITTLSFAYTNVLDDQTADIKQQIEELKTDTEMAQDMKDRMINSLNAMIPSENNTKVVNDLMADAVYGDKIKLLETTEE